MRLRERLGKVLRRLKGEVEEKKGEKGWIVGGGLQCEDRRRRGAGGRRRRKKKSIKG